MNVPDVLSAAEQRLFDAFVLQQRWCADASPFTAWLLSRMRRWLRQAPDAVDARVRMLAVADDPAAGAVPLRAAGALHHLALRGLQPWRALWPPQGHVPTATNPDPALDVALDQAIAIAWREHREELVRAWADPPQTNEVARSAVLLPALLQLAARHPGLPLTLLEIGASAGLNLWPDGWRYDFGGWSWGPADAPLLLQAAWRGPVPTGLPPVLPVIGRRGCDRRPVDLQDPDERLRLASFVWPDQGDRLQRLLRASAAVRTRMADAGVRVEALSASAFLRPSLADRPGGSLTVVLHTIVWQYLGAQEQAAVASALAEAGARADAQRPLAWLRMEPPAPEAPVELRCTVWPGGEDRLLGCAHPHGTHIDWRGDGTP